MLCLTGNGLYAQLRLQGFITDSATAERLPFVNIGISQKNLGTVAAEDGTFTIDIPEQYLADTLSFSMIGYHELQLPIRQLAGRKNIALRPMQVGLHAVVVSGKKLVERKYGLKNNPLMHFWDASINQNDIFEIAQLIKTGKGISKITSVNLLIGQHRNDSGTFRINFYEYDGHYPANRILTKSIVQTHAIKQGWLRFDISEHSVYVKENVVVAIEFIPTGKTNTPVVYEIKPGGFGKSYVRTSSLGTWQMPPHQYRMYVTALTTEADPSENETPEKDIAPAFRLFSNIVNDSFSIFARLPEGYKKQLGAAPVIYLLDANLYFEYLADSINKIKGEQPVLVGVGYSNFAEMDRLRDRDYTYPPALLADSFKLSGGGDKFYRFFKEELIPVIEEKYNLGKRERTIMGHSLGGYFALYALYKDLGSSPGVFQNYVAASPSIDYHNSYLPKQFKEIKTGQALSPATVHITWGGIEDYSGSKDKNSDLIRDFLGPLSHLNTAVRINKIFLPFAGHMETAIPGFYLGLNGYVE